MPRNGISTGVSIGQTEGTSSNYDYASPASLAGRLTDSFDITEESDQPERSSNDHRMVSVSARNTGDSELTTIGLIRAVLGSYYIAEDYNAQLRVLNYVTDRIQERAANTNDERAASRRLR